MTLDYNLGPEWVSGMANRVRQRYLLECSWRVVQVGVAVSLVVFGVYSVNGGQKRLVAAQNIQGFLVTQVDQTLAEVELDYL